MEENLSISDLSASVGREEYETLRTRLNDVDAACRALPAVEQAQYREAQDSIAEARRSAVAHEGLLRFC